MAARAPLIEIFRSIQGEGRFVGVPTVFVRTATCPLRCLYCDTPNSYTAPQAFGVRLAADEFMEPNPVSAGRTAELVRGAGACVSVTGGEPLVFPEFVAALGALLRPSGVRLHLETATIDPDAMAACATSIDHLSADYKLSATLGEPVGGPAPDRDGGYGERHLRCVELAIRGGASVDCKVVLTAAVTDEALAGALRRLAPLRRRILLVLQPVTPFGAVAERLPTAALERHLRSAERAGFDVRVLPQVHKALELP